MKLLSRMLLYYAHNFLLHTTVIAISKKFFQTTRSLNWIPESVKKI